MREIKPHMQVLQAAKRISRAARVEPCHWLDWSEGCNNNVGGRCRKGEPHNASNARGVTAGKMGRNSSLINVTNMN